MQKKVALITTSSFAKNSEVPLHNLEKAGLKAILNPFKKTLNKAEIRKLIAEFKPIGIIAGVEPLDAEVLREAPGLKIISRCGIDVENIDIETAKDLGIRVFNTPDAPTQAVAELTVALLLNVIRRVGEADRNIRDGKWEKLMGSLLSDMTVGIIGCGRIGNKVAGYLKPFGCRILGSDISVKENKEIRIVPLKELLEKSDIITFHVPATKDTIDMVGHSFITSMRPCSFIINTARGDIINESALIEGLQSGKIAGAALDTFKNEPYAGPLTGFKNVLLTAHMGSYAKEARIQMELQATNNLLKGLEGLI